jgi:hypothetical protein
MEIGQNRVCVYIGEIKSSPTHFPNCAVDVQSWNEPRNREVRKNQLPGENDTFFWMRMLTTMYYVRVHAITHQSQTGMKIGDF